MIVYLCHLVTKYVNNKLIIGCLVSTEIRLGQKTDLCQNIYLFLTDRGVFRVAFGYFESVARLIKTVRRLK